MLLSRPIPSLRLRALSVALLALAPAAAAQGTVWVVDDDGGAGVDFAELQDAVDAAAAGDTLLVRPGSYGPLEAAKALTVVGDGAARPTVQSGEVSAIAAGQHFVLRGLDFEEHLWVADSAGQVWLEECSTAGGDANVPHDGQTDYEKGARIDDCAEVVVVRCDFSAATSFPFESYPPGEVPEFERREGLFVTFSEVHLYGSTVTGSIGQAVGPGGDPTGNGAPALYLLESTLIAVDSVLQGGQGGAGFCDAPLEVSGGKGGDGLWVVGEDAEAYLYGTSLLGGPGGTAVFCGDPTPPELVGELGRPYKLEFGVLEENPGGGRAYSASATTRVGEAIELVFDGEMGDLAFVAHSPGPTGFHLPDASGSLLVGLPFGLELVGVQTTAGPLEVGVPLVTIPAGLQAVRLFTQAVVAGADASAWLGEGSVLVLLDGAL